MRSNYPVSSKEMLGELRDLQETLISLIGYDSNAFDDAIDISGSIGVLDNSISNAGASLTELRLYSKQIPDYNSVYRNRTILNQSRRK